MSFSEILFNIIKCLTELNRSKNFRRVDSHLTLNDSPSDKTSMLWWKSLNSYRNFKLVCQAWQTTKINFIKPAEPLCKFYIPKYSQAAVTFKFNEIFRSKLMTPRPTQPLHHYHPAPPSLSLSPFFHFFNFWPLLCSFPKHNSKLTYGDLGKKKRLWIIQ